MLKTTGGIGQAHGKNQPLILAISSHKRSLFYAFFVHSNLPVAGAEVQAAKHTTTSKATHQVISARNRKFIANCSLVKLPVINAESQGTIWLTYQKHRACIRALAGTDATRSKQLLNLRMHQFRLGGTMAVRWQCNWFCSWLQSHFMDILNAASRW